MITQFLRTRGVIVASALALCAVSAYAQSPRMVVVEEATNASCPPCAAANPAFEALLSQYQDIIIPVIYHSSWPGPNDPMYRMDTMASQNRVQSYYQIQGVPNAMLNGNTFNGSPTALGAFAYLADSLRGTMSPITMNVTSSISGTTGNASVRVASTQSLAGKRLRITVSEGHIHSTTAGSNGETDFYYTVRKMLPDANGTTLTIGAGGDTTYNFSFPIPTTWKTNDIYVVAFVQDDATKEIMQGAATQGKFNTAGSDNPIGIQPVANTGKDFNLSLAPTVPGNYTVTITKSLPGSWTTSITSDGTPVANNSTVTLSQTASLKATITPAGSKPGTGTVTLRVAGDKGAIYESTFRLYSTPGVKELVLKKDEGTAAIGTNYSVAMDKTGYTSVMVENGDEKYFDLKAYDAIVIEVGKNAFIEQDATMLKDYLEGGGRLLLAGAEIGYGLADPASPGNGAYYNPDFMSTYLHSTYVADAGPKTGTSFMVNGYGGDPIGDGMSFSISNGVNNQDTPDEIAPLPGAERAFSYGADGAHVAGIRYANDKYRLVYLGFGLEGIGDINVRTQVLKKSLDWLLMPEGGITGVRDQASANATVLESAIPNPANGSFVVPFSVVSAGNVRIAMYDMQGRLVADLANSSYAAGAHRVSYNAKGIPAGVYNVVMTANGSRRSQLVTIVR